MEIAGKLGNNAVSISFTDQDIDISTAIGRLMYQITGAFAEYEREILRERTKAGMRRAKRQGKKIGRPKINGMTKMKIFELKEKGLSVRDIAKETSVSIGKVSQVLNKR